MSYVGATAASLDHLGGCLERAGDEASTRRARIAAMLREAGELTSTVSTLTQVEQWAVTTAAEAKRAAELAAADASVCPPSAPAQTGLRSSMGLVDDVLLDVFFVNDLSRLIRGRDINTGTDVGPGGRALSALGLIPFGKVAKLGKIAVVADGASPAARVGVAPLQADAVVATVRLRSAPDDVIGETLQRRGNFTSGHAVNDDEALDVGIAFLGDGYRELGRSGSGVFRSRDGLRQFRIDSTSLAGSHQPWEPHVHLQVFASPTARRELVNNHIPLRE